jgi:hypothetical protein
MLVGQSLANNLPKFSWDTVPVYAHFGATGGMSDTEIEFIANHYHFITLEKAHGASLHNGMTEPQTFADVARIKKINPDAQVLFYWNLLLDYTTYQMSKVRPSNENWFIHNLDGDLHLKGKTKLKYYDLSNKDFQRWWVSSAAKALKEGNMDGVFIDALPQIGLSPEDRIKEWGKEKYTEVEQGINQTLSLLKSTIGADKTVIYNGIRSIPNGWSHGGSKYLEHTSGTIIEHFNVFKSQESEQIAADLHGMIAAGKAGKIVILKAWPGFTWLDYDMIKLPKKERQQIAKDNIIFPLAAFLIAASENSYFNYTWGYRSHHGAYDWYPEFDQKLGEPLGDAIQEGYEYKRDFKHASVYLNIESKKAKINWK